MKYWVSKRKHTLLEGDVGESLGKVEPDLGIFDWRIIYRDACTLGKEIANERDGGRFAGVASVGLECKAEDGDVLPKSGQQPSVNMNGKGLLCW